MKYISLIKDKSFAIWGYLCKDVWSDTRDDWRIRFIKTINLSVRSFLDSDLQSRAAGLTYRTLLALVPALAILFAIGRGFGFHKLLHKSSATYLLNAKLLKQHSVSLKHILHNHLKGYLLVLVL